MRKGFISFILAFVLMCSMIMTVSAAANNTYVIEADNATEVIDLGTLPDDGTPVTIICYLNSDNKTRSSEYIVFTMTRSEVRWTCVGVPSDQIFIGTMDITNITTGLSCGSSIRMHGTSGSVTYYGISGHMYTMSFSGALWKTDSNGFASEKVSNESGRWSWSVPIDN